jgi:hypothetical protein
MSTVGLGAALLANTSGSPLGAQADRERLLTPCASAATSLSVAALTLSTLGTLVEDLWIE